MTFTLPKSTKILWQAQSAFVTVFFCLLFPLVMSELWVLIVVLLFAAFFIFVYIPIYHKTYKIILYDEFITVKKQFLFKSAVTLPFRRISIVKTFVTPLSKLTKTETIIIKTSRATIIIPFIYYLHAKHIKERIIND